MKSNANGKTVAERKRLLKLALKVLRDQATEDEELSLNQELEEILILGDQALLDHLTAEIENVDSSFRVHWLDYVGNLSNVEVRFNDSGEQDQEARLFIIPVVVGIQAQKEGESDLFEIGTPGKVREMMVKSGLISDDSETIRIFTDIFSPERMTHMSATRRYKALQSLLSGQKKYALSAQDKETPALVSSNVLEIKFKFIVGCAELRAQGKQSPLFVLLNPAEDVPDQEMEQSVMAMFRFTEELSKNLPGYMNKKPGAKVVFTRAFSVLEFSRMGLLSAFKEFDQFKGVLLLSRSQELECPWIKVRQSRPELLDISLFEGDELVESITISSLHETAEEMVIFLNDFYDRMEAYGFSLKPGPGNDDELVFFRKRRSKSRFDGRPSSELLH